MRCHLLRVLFCQVLLVSPVLRVLTVGPVRQVSLELLVDQESLADREHQACQERRVRQVGTGSQDQLESKESQVSHDRMEFLYFKLASICLG